MRSSTAGARRGAGKAARVSLQIDGSLPDIVRVRVHNAGAIPAELITRIFDPMIAGDRRRDGSRGLGLGLFITQRIVEAHGGSRRRGIGGEHGHDVHGHPASPRQGGERRHLGGAKPCPESAQGDAAAGDRPVA